MPETPNQKTKVCDPAGAALSTLLSTLTPISDDLVLLCAKVTRLATMQGFGPVAPAPQPSITGTGHGASSSSIYEAMTARAWTGRLGRTHMAEVDKLSPTALLELDCYLRRTIHRAIPVDGAYGEINADNVFAALAVFGLRLEDRGAMADVTVFDDTPTRSQMARMQNLGALYLRRGNKYDYYWKGSAMETLVELACYRGLWDADGFVKV